jgi:hypothetical protein
MKKFKILTTCAIAMISLAVNAQTDVDALRYSMIGFGGTARYSSMGGAFGAIGADFSTISVNPAGLGVYRKNEFTFTPSIYTGKTTATYNGNTAEDNKYNFNFSNIGVVYAKSTNKTKDQPGWKSVNFAFGLNRYNSFHNRMVIEGSNKKSSLMNVYKNVANGTAPGDLDQFSTQLAFNTYLLDTNGATTYFSNVPSGGVLQRKSVETRGSMQEMVFALGANYNNKLFIGGTLGVSYLRYFEQAAYKEIDDGDTIPYFNNFTLNQDLTTSGSGFNFKFGLLYVPVDVDMLKVKIGAAVHTPTFYALHDEWSSKMESSFTVGSFSDESPQGDFDYQLTTPMRAIGSLAIQIGQYGTISADYEFVDYSEARLRSRKYKYFDENEIIQNKYTATNNLRFGAEAALGLFSIRGGYAIYGSPYKSGINDGKKTYITGGFGIIDKNYFVDFGYVYSTSTEDYYLYNYSDMTPASTKKHTQNFLITLGFKF